MKTHDRRDLRIEITEDATSGISIRLHHNGRFPDPLAGFSKDVLRKSRPLIWNSFERRVLKKARAMSRPSYRIIRDTLIAERAMRVEEKLRIKQSREPRRWPSPFKFMQRLRLNAKKQEEAERRVLDLLPQQHKELTLTEMLRAQSGTALASPIRGYDREHTRSR